MAKLILSTVGTSLLTNVLTGDLRTDLIKKANLSQEEGQKDESLQGLIEYGVKPKIKEKFQSNDLNVYKQMSAELNGIIGTYDGELKANSHDIHVFIATDTYQGYETALILEGFMKERNFITITYTPKNLSTKDKKSFIKGIKDLLEWFEDENGLNIHRYKSEGYEIIFNLTGGFKSLQGYLNVIGMFYADSINYIFERSSEMLEIPKLPIQIAKDIFYRYATQFALMAEDLPISKSDLHSISETLLEEYESDTFLLSPWGLLSWNKVKSEVLSHSLLQLKYLAYEDSFQKDFQAIDKTTDKVKLQETLVKVSKVLQETDGNITKLKGGQAGGILYDNYTGKNSHIGHFRINQGRRVSCIYKNQKLRLRHYGEHDYVNDNP